MRFRRCLVCLLLAALSLLCACGTPPQTTPLLPFSAALSVTSKSQTFAGAFSLQDGENMRLILQTPAELRGLHFVLENGNVFLRFGEASINAADAESVGLPPTAANALFQTLSALCQAPQPLSENGTAQVSTPRGTASVSFSPDRLPQRVTIGDTVFEFKAASADVL